METAWVSLKSVSQKRIVGEGLQTLAGVSGSEDPDLQDEEPVRSRSL